MSQKSLYFHRLKKTGRTPPPANPPKAPIGAPPNPPIPEGIPANGIEATGPEAAAAAPPAGDRAPLSADSTIPSIAPPEELAPMPRAVLIRSKIGPPY